MLEMVKGCEIPDASGLCPGYEIVEGGLCANVDAGKILPLVEAFLSLQEDRVFFILEVPTRAEVEKQLRAEGQEGPHMDVYYWDGLPKEYAIDFLEKNQELLINDGMSIFGFAAVNGGNEILLERYNVIRIFSGNSQKYENLFAKFDIPKVMELKTAWSQFREGSWGECRLYRRNGKTIYDFVEFLKPYGLYLAERRVRL